MGRRTLSVALFAAALSFGTAAPSANPQVNTQSEEKDSAAKLSGGTSTIVDAINHIRAEKDVGCEDRKDKRSSDLCAQWKAADAARDALDYTFLAVFLSFVGTALVALTFWEQRRVSRRQLRAYLSVKMETLSTFGDTKHVQVAFALKNGGATPAYEVVHMGTVVIWDVPLPGDPGELFRKPPARGLPTPGVIHSQDDHYGVIESASPLDIEENVEAITKEQKAIYAVGEVHYRDTFNKKHITEFCFYLCGEDFRRSSIASKAKPGHPVHTAWGVANFHNDAT